MRVRLGRSILVACAVFALAGAVHAGAINVFNTGVTGAGVSALDGTVDLHYTLTTVPAGAANPGTRVRTSVDGYPIDLGPWSWIGDNAISAWIGPNYADDLTGPAGDYIYRTTFDLTGLNPSSAVITGQWAVDDRAGALNILLNGVTTGSLNPWWNAWLPFSISSGFVAGVNTLDFVVTNDSGPTGLRVEMSGTASAATAIPEPASLVLLGAGLAALMALRRRRLV